MSCFPWKLLAFSLTKKKTKPFSNIRLHTVRQTCMFCYVWENVFAMTQSQWHTYCFFCVVSHRSAFSCILNNIRMCLLKFLSICLLVFFFPLKNVSNTSHQKKKKKKKDKNTTKQTSVYQHWRTGKRMYFFKDFFSWI